jgi:hypothetical protein
MRESMRFHPDVVALLNSLWALAKDRSSSAMQVTVGGYCAVYVTVYRKLLGEIAAAEAEEMGLSEDEAAEYASDAVPSLEDAMVLAGAEFKRDSKGQAAMAKNTFVSSW